MDSGKVKDNNKVLLAIGAVAVIAIGIQSSQSDKKPKAAPPPVVKPAKPVGIPDWQRTSVAQDDVKKRLRDPASAQFSDLTVRNGVVCGQVNSRNGFGGMTGPQQFISRLGVMTVFKDDVAGDGFAKTWASVCP